MSEGHPFDRSDYVETLDKIGAQGRLSSFRGRTGNPDSSGSALLSGQPAARNVLVRSFTELVKCVTIMHGLRKERDTCHNFDKLVSRGYRVW